MNKNIPQTYTVDGHYRSYKMFPFLHLDLRNIDDNDIAHFMTFTEDFRKEFTCSSIERVDGEKWNLLFYAPNEDIFYTQEQIEKYDCLKNLNKKDIIVAKKIKANCKFWKNIKILFFHMKISLKNILVNY